MQKLPSLIPNIEGISVENVTRWLNKPYHDIVIQNKVANQIIYPQAVAQTPEQMEIDLAILREILRTNPKKYFNNLSSRILIPEDLTKKYPDLVKLTWAFIDVFRPQGITKLTLVTEKFGYQDLGTFLRPEITSPQDVISLTVGGKKYSTRVGGLLVIPTQGAKVDIQFDSSGAKLLGKNTVMAEVSAGIVGVILDTRAK